jgi:hypothetical protein
MNGKIVTKIINAINVAGFKLVYLPKINDFVIIEDYGILKTSERLIRNYSSLKYLIKNKSKDK